MSFMRFVEVMRARWRLAAQVLAGCVVLALVASLVQPRQYKATASVLVDMRSPDPLASTMLGGMMNTGYMATQMDLVQSERVARRAIESLGLQHDAKLQAEWRKATDGQGDFEAWLAEQLQRKLDVQPTRESGVMSLTFTADTAQRAADVTNAFMRAYIDTSLELRVEPAKSYNGFFDERAKQLSQALDEAQAKLSTFQQANNLVATDERVDVENMRLADLSSQLVSLQAAAADSSSREQQAQANPDKAADVLGNPAVAALNTELARQQIRLGELRQRLSDRHPQVLEVENNITTLRGQIEQEKRRVFAGVGANNQLNHSREAQLRALLDEQRAKVAHLKMLRDQASSLQRDVDNAKIAYDNVQQHVRQTGLESHLTQTNVSVLRQATLPTTAASPKPLAALVTALVLGTLLGVAAVLVREISDRRMRTAEDVIDLLHMPLLVVLPHTPPRKSPRASGTDLVKARILGGLFRPAS